MGSNADGVPTLTLPFPCCCLDTGTTIPAGNDCDRCRDGTTPLYMQLTIHEDTWLDVGSPTDWGYTGDTTECPGGTAASPPASSLTGVFTIKQIAESFLSCSQFGQEWWALLEDLDIFSFVKRCFYHSLRVDLNAGVGGVEVFVRQKITWSSFTGNGHQINWKTIVAGTPDCIEDLDGLSIPVDSVFGVADHMPVKPDILANIPNLVINKSAGPETLLYELPS